MADASPRAVKRPRSGESASLGVSPALKLGVVIGNSALDLSGVVSAQKALHRDFEVCSAVYCIHQHGNPRTLTWARSNAFFFVDFGG